MVEMGTKRKESKTPSHRKKRQDLVILGHEERGTGEEGRGEADWEVSSLAKRMLAPPRK